MKWRFPFSRVAREGVLTRDKPIEKLRAAGEEVQDRCVTAAEFAVEGLAAEAEVKDNVLRVTGSVTGGDLSARVRALEEAIYGAKLQVDIGRVDAGVAATGILTWGGNFGGAESVEGEKLGVQGCGEEEEDA